MDNGDILGWVVWFFYACGPPLFFLCWGLWRWRVERPGFCEFCKRWHGRKEADDC